MKVGVMFTVGDHAFLSDLPFQPVAGMQITFKDGHAADVTFPGGEPPPGWIEKNFDRPKAIQAMCDVLAEFDRKIYELRQQVEAMNF